MDSTAVRSHRRTVLLTFLAVVAVSLAGCGGTPATPAGAETSSGPVASIAPSGSASASASVPAGTGSAAALTCAGLDNARIFGTTDPYNLSGEAGIPLASRQWSGPDGRHVSLQPPCSVGDLDGHPGDEVVAAVMFDITGTTGRIWSLIMCKRQGTGVICGVVKSYDDREPVQSITIRDETAIVVYLTRTPGLPPAAVNVRRTVVYQFAGNTLRELRHGDESYTP